MRVQVLDFYIYGRQMFLKSYKVFFFSRFVPLIQPTNLTKLMTGILLTSSLP